MSKESFAILHVWVNWLGFKAMRKPLSMWEIQHFGWYATRGYHWLQNMSFDIPSLEESHE